MRGSRPLMDEEVRLIAKSFSGVFSNINKVLYVFRYRTGFRISELLSLRVRDVMQHGKILGAITVARRHMKGKTGGRTLPLHAAARAALSGLA